MGYNPDGSYTNSRTGRTWANEAMSIQMDGVDTGTPTVSYDPIVIPPSASSPGGIDTRARDQYGNLTTNQMNSSQYWMNAGYTGEDPNMAVKAYYSDAQVAYNNAVAIANAAAVKYGTVTLNPAVAQIATVQSGLPAENEGVMDANRYIREMDDTFNVIGNWVAQHAVIIIAVLAGLFILPRVFSSSGRGY